MLLPARSLRWLSMLLPSLILPTLCFPSLQAQRFRPERKSPDDNEHDVTGVRQTIAQIQQQIVEGSFAAKRDLTQPVQVDGSYTFIPPDFDAGDQRGPCPGLNALANHGYISHDGITNLAETLQAVYEVYHMNIDLGTVLITLALVFTGNPLSFNPTFSIGGIDSRVTDAPLSDLLGGLIGTPRGLEGSHNFIETDGSLTRDDLYVTGNAWDLNMTKFLQVYNWGDDGVDSPLNFDDVGDISAMRWKEAENTNPWFWYGPLTGYLPRTGGFALTARTMSNYTEGSLDGVITKAMFKSFFAVVDDPSTSSGLTYNRGWERIPENWYRRPVPWGLVDLNLDVLTWAQTYPFLLDIGGNTGQVNTFTGIDLSDIFGGLLNATILLEGNNLICFSLEVAKTLGPNSLSTLYSSLSVPISLVSGIVAAPLLDLTCPVYNDLSNNGESIRKTLLATYPGANRSGSVL